MGRDNSGRRVMIIAGEASGDSHGAKVVRAMKKRAPDLEFVGIGGKALRAEGVRIAVDSKTLSVVGITEVLFKLPQVLHGIRTARKLLRELRPTLLVLIDFPDFNLFVAATAKKLNIPVLYYISPQVWAWRTGRVKKIRRLVDRMAVILPFEEAFYRKHGVPVAFVGHPLLDSSPPPKRPELTGKGLVLGLLPGSRDREVLQLLPIMLKAARLLKEKHLELQILVSLASSLEREFVESIVEANRAGLDVEIVEGGAHRTFGRATILVAASGTVTLEAALAGIPMVIIYKVSPLSYRVGKALVRVKYVSLANLIAGRELLPELLQEKATAGNISFALEKMLGDRKKLFVLRKQLLNMRRVFGGPGASERVAKIALSMLE